MNQQTSHPAIKRFWATLAPEVRDILSDDQREEISDALMRANPRKGDYSDVRFTFFGHFLVFLWGKERRSRKRLDKESEVHPILAARNLPIIAAIGGAIISICYVALHTSGRALISMMN